MDEPGPRCWIAASAGLPPPFATGRSTGSFAGLSTAFPTVTIGMSEAIPPDVDERSWRSDSFDFWAFDRTMDERRGGRFRVAVRASEPERTIGEVLTRCQRLLERKNAASAGGLFDHVLTVHRAMHELERPLVRADYDHALDVWQWVLRLDPEASLDVQIAALFHDVERLATEADVRIEHHAPDYAAFKTRHAAAGAELADAALGRAGAPAALRTRVRELISGHERPARDPERMLLNEADALSFFSLNSPGFFDYFAADHCETKVRYTLDRLGPRGRALLRTLRLRSDVASVVRDAGGLS